MSPVNIIISIVLGIVLLGAIGGEGYFYFYSQKQNSSTESVIQSIQEKLKAKPSLDALAVARSDLQAQTDRLKEMQAGFPSSAALDAEIKADVSAAAAEEAKADSLAADPKLDISAQPNIVELGQKAAQALSYLEYLATTPASTVALNDAAENAVELVAAYTKELAAYINSLTPSNSGLSAGEISDYQSQAESIVAQVGSTQDSLNKIDSISASSVADASPVGGQSGSNAQSAAGTSIAGQTGSNLSSDSSVSSSSQTSSPSSGQSSPDNGSVTLGDIVAQQAVVTEDTNTVNQLSDQVSYGSASSTDSSNASLPPADATGDTSSGNGINNSGNNNGSNQSQSQSGAIKLIEGENTF